MKKYLKYIICCVFALAFPFCYGLLLNSIMAFPVFLLISTVSPFVVMIIFNEKNSTSKPTSIALKSLVISIALMLVSVGVYNVGNRITYNDYLGEYKVVVKSLNGKGGGTAGFTDPDGEYGNVDLNDYRWFYFDDDDIVEEGDTILVQKYIGFFNEVYYVFVDEVK